VSTDSGVDVLDTPQAGPAAIRGSFLRTGGYVAGLLLALASTPLLFRHLGVAEFGRYTTVLSLITLAAGFSEGGINSIALREWATRAPGERQRLMANLLGMRIVLSIAAVAGALLFGVLAGYDSVLMAATAVAGVGLIAQTAQSLLASPLQAELRFGWATIADLLRQVTLVAFLVGLIVAGAGVVPLVAAQVPAALAALVLTVVLVRSDVPLRPRLDRREWGPLLRHAFPYALAIAVNIAYFRIGILFMSITASEDETGYFATSFRILEVVVIVPPVLMAAAFPILSRAARDDADRFSYATRRVFEVALLVGGAAVVILELGSQLAIDVLAGPEFAPAVDILRIQAPAALATFAAVACAYPLLSLHRHREVLIACSVGLVLTFAALFALVPPFEGEGAGAATLLAEIGVAVTMATLLVRSHDGLKLPLATLTWVLFAMVPALALHFVPGLPDVLDVLLGLAVYGGVLVVAGRAPRELLDAVRR